MATAQTKIIAQKMKLHAQQLHDRILKIGLFLKRHWAEVGSITDEFKGQNLWRYMGCKDFETWRRKVMLGRSTMYSNLRRWNGVKGGIKNKKIELADVEKITGENADWLIKLPEKERFDKMWIKRAQTMDEDEFQSCVEKALPKSVGKDASGIEDRVDFKVRCYKSQVEMFEDILSDVCSAHNLKKDDRARALEIIFVAYRNSDEETKMRVLTVMGQCIIHQHQALTRINEVTKSDKAADEQLVEVLKLNADMAVAIADVMKKHGEQLTLANWTGGKKSKSRTNGNGKPEPAKAKKAGESPLQAIDGGKAAAKPVALQ